MNKPLTDADLDTLLAEHSPMSSNENICNWDADKYPCATARAIEELRDRRQAMSMCADAEADIDALREQNAKLVAALNARVAACTSCRAPNYCQPCLDARYASVKGEQG